MCEPPCFHLVSREHLADEAIEVWGFSSQSEGQALPLHLHRFP
jgi:hypothetical protein